jgi:hypothetical protein
MQKLLGDSSLLERFVYKEQGNVFAVPNLDHSC